MTATTAEPKTLSDYDRKKLLAIADAGGDMVTAETVYGVNQDAWSRSHARTHLDHLAEAGLITTAFTGDEEDDVEAISLTDAGRAVVEECDQERDRYLARVVTAASERWERLDEAIADIESAWQEALDASPVEAGDAVADLHAAQEQARAAVRAWWDGHPGRSQLGELIGTEPVPDYRIRSNVGTPNTGAWRRYPDRARLIDSAREATGIDITPWFDDLVNDTRTGYTRSLIGTHVSDVVSWQRDNFLEHRAAALAARTARTAAEQAPAPQDRGINPVHLVDVAIYAGGLGLAFGILIGVLIHMLLT